MRISARTTGLACVGAVLLIATGEPDGVQRALAQGSEPSRRAFAREDVLTGSGVATAAFGESPRHVTEVLSPLLGPPSHGYGPYLGVCAVDHAIDWRALHLFFFHGRFVGYSYAPQSHERAPVLATDRGLAVGDTMSVGRRLYHGRFRLTTAQGGAWFAVDRLGPVDGLAAGGPPPVGSDIGPLSRATSIGAGHQGCPAMAP